MNECFTHSEGRKNEIINERDSNSSSEDPSGGK